MFIGTDLYPRGFQAQEVSCRFAMSSHGEGSTPACSSREDGSETIQEGSLIRRNSNIRRLALALFVFVAVAIPVSLSSRSLSRSFRLVKLKLSCPSLTCEGLSSRGACNEATRHCSNMNCAWENGQCEVCPSNCQNCNGYGNGTSCIECGKGYVLKWDGIKDVCEADTLHDVRFPTNTRIAILIRGQAFRSGRYTKGCNPHNQSAQLNASQSLLDMIVAPLQDNGNIVKLFAVFGNASCKLMSLLEDLYSGTDLSIARFKSSPNQATDMRRALDLLKMKAGGLQGVADKFDTVMVARHDMLWTSPIHHWPTVQFGSFNFYSRCEPTDQPRTSLNLAEGGPPDNCVNDMFFMMSGSQFAAFDSAVGTESTRCFSKKYPRKGGHGCYKPVTSNVSENLISFVTGFVPKASVRERSDVAAVT